MFGKQHLLLFLLMGAAALAGSIPFSPPPPGGQAVKRLSTEAVARTPAPSPTTPGPSPGGPTASARPAKDWASGEPSETASASRRLPTRGVTATEPAAPLPAIPPPAPHYRQDAPAAQHAQESSAGPIMAAAPERRQSGMTAPFWGAPAAPATGTQPAADPSVEGLPTRRHRLAPRGAATGDETDGAAPGPATPGSPSSGPTSGGKAPVPPPGGDGGGESPGTGRPPEGTERPAPTPPPAADGGSSDAPNPGTPPGGAGGEGPSSPPPAAKPNTAPVAAPGPDQAAQTGEPVTLDGSGSRDADGDPLVFIWTLVSKPDGSRAALSDPAAARPSFTPDLPGLYLIELVVDDGRHESPAQTVLVEAAAWRATVPQLVGLDVVDARSALLAAKLKVGRITVAAADSVPRNRVLAQNPAAGTRVPEDTPADLVIALPPSADDDGDGLPDAWEYAAFGGLEQGGGDDPDRDGFTNLQEHSVGTGPNDAGDAPVRAGNYFEYDMFGRIVVKQIAAEP